MKVSPVLKTNGIVASIHRIAARVRWPWARDCSYDSRHLLPLPTLDGGSGLWGNGGRLRIVVIYCVTVGSLSRELKLPSGSLLRLSFSHRYAVYRGGPDETRTRDLCHAKAALSQLSYGPKIIPGYSTVSVLDFLSIATAKRRYEVYHAAFARFKCA